MKGMILAAGKGTRLKPLTDKTPKPLIKVGNQSMLDITLLYLKRHGINDVIINVHYLSDQIIEYAKRKNKEGYNIQISDESEELLDTGGGLKKASSFLKSSDNFILAASDIVTGLDLSEMIHFHEKNNALVTLAVKDRKTSRSLLFDNNNQLSGWRHNQTGEKKLVPGKSGVNGFGFSGYHVINSKIFDLIEEDGAFSIINLYLRLAEKQKILGYYHNDPWFEFGRVQNIEEHSQNKEFSSILNKLYID